MKFLTTIALLTLSTNVLASDWKMHKEGFAYTVNDAGQSLTYMCSESTDKCFIGLWQQQLTCVEDGEYPFLVSFSGKGDGVVYHVNGHCVDSEPDSDGDYGLILKNMDGSLAGGAELANYTKVSIAMGAANGGFTAFRFSLKGSKAVIQRETNQRGNASTETF